LPLAAVVFPETPGFRHGSAGLTVREDPIACILEKQKVENLCSD
jgi:hypothetical protein